MVRGGSLLATGWLCFSMLSGPASVSGQAPSPGRPAGQSLDTLPLKSPQRALLDRYCVTCHNERLKTANLMLDLLDVRRVREHPDRWESVVRKLRGGLMPPSALPRPDAVTLDGFVSWLEEELDSAAALNPNPGRTETFHRLNRVEYRHAVRDILALDIDVEELLPADSASYGFDNIAGALKVSESLMERYLTAARRISRAAVGSPPPGPVAETYKISPALPQHEHVDGLPFGTRGGALIRHQFPQDAVYQFRFELANLTSGADLEFLLDGVRIRQLKVDSGQRAVDADGNELAERLEVTIPVTAGPHDIGVAFLRTPSLLAETNRRPFLNPTVSRPSMASLRSVIVTGPFDATGVGDTPSRTRIFSCTPADPAEESQCARSILSRLARSAFRRPVDDADLGVLLAAYKEGRADGDFENGIERAVRQMLVSPEFLFRVEGDPPARSAASMYRLSDLALASRLSFFLWSSVPDDELISVAAAGRLQDPTVLDAQVRRMIADDRSAALTANFVGQWLQLRNLESAAPSEVLFPDFDDGLREGLRRETELFFESILRENRSAIELLTADYTFVNDRVARHYGLANVSGSRFRRVSLADEQRRGLLGHGSILTITSHPVRTSPVFRGKWILDNILGTPPPPPPPNVPALPERTGAYANRTASMRERMSAHRENPACASCHAMIDPLGFGLEHYDPVGRWRDVDELYSEIDASGVLPDGTAFSGVDELNAALVRRPERFVTTLTEKLLIYALGRGLEPTDMPAVRKIVRDAARDDYKLRSIVLGVVNSLPFQYRRPS